VDYIKNPHQNKGNKGPIKDIVFLSVQSENNPKTHRTSWIFNQCIASLESEEEHSEFSSKQNYILVASPVVGVDCTL